MSAVYVVYDDVKGESVGSSAICCCRRELPNLLVLRDRRSFLEGEDGAETPNIPPLGVGGLRFPWDEDETDETESLRTKPPGAATELDVLMRKFAESGLLGTILGKEGIDLDCDNDVLFDDEAAERIEAPSKLVSDVSVSR